MKCPRHPRYVQLESSLDLNWDEPDERNLALGMDVLERVETQIQQQSQANDHPLVLSSIQTARQVEKQDVEVDSSVR